MKQIIITLFLTLSLLGCNSIRGEVFKNKPIQDTLSNYTAHRDYLSESFYLRNLSYYEKYKKNKNTRQMVSALINLSEYEKLNEKYSLAFDHLWEALYLCNQDSLVVNTLKTHRNLGILYDLFGLEKESTKHHRIAKNIAQHNIKNDKSNQLKDLLYSCNMNLAIRERKSGNYKKALIHVDSCYIQFAEISNEKNPPSFLAAEKGYNLLKLNKVEEAEPYLQAALNEALEKKQIYTANILNYIGELYSNKNQHSKAITYLKRALDLAKNEKFEKNLQIEILQNLASEYVIVKEFKAGYDALMEAQIISNEIQKAKNKTNGELFKIKNTYLTSLKQKNKQLEIQQMELEAERLTKTRLKLILLLGALLLLTLSVTFWMRIKLKRTVLEKQESDLKAKHIEDKTNLELESKSKELTSYALQLIDKESAIEELLKTLEAESSPQHHFLKNKHTKGSQNLWNEFNLRFTEVNNAFYERLQKKHPDLSPTEQKHCALIKLNFNTKEMARILNIENHSVHISRSRIRKKIGMERSESLDRYINEL